MARLFSRRTTSVLAWSAVGLYAATLAGVYLRQRDMLYRAPRKTQSPDLPTPLVPLCALGPTLHGWVDNPGCDQALIYFGGSSEPVELRRQSLAEAFPNHTRYLVPYRGFGPNAHLKSEEAAIKLDARRTFACVAKNHRHVDVLGRSLGTGVALHVAARENVRRLGLITPYDSIVAVAQSRYRFLPVKFMLRDRFESWKDAINVTAPICAVLAETDPVTPHKCWENLKRHLKTTVDMSISPNTDHSNIVQSPATWSALTAFFTNV